MMDVFDQLDELEAIKQSLAETSQRVDRLIDVIRREYNITTIDLSSLKCNCNGPIVFDGNGTKTEHLPQCNLFKGDDNAVAVQET